MPALYLLLGLLPWMCLGASTSGSKITCQAGIFEIGQPASVTCNFHKNLRESKTSFYVEERFFDSNITRSVYTCHWLEDSSLYCVNDDGFVLRNNDATDHLTLDIREFAVKHAGEYRCLVIDDETQTEKCSLLPNLHVLQPQSGSSDTVGHTVVLIVIVVALVVIGVIVAGILTYRLCRRRRRPQSDEGVELPLMIVRSTSPTLADNIAESPDNTLLQAQATSSTNSYQFKLNRTGSQTLVDYEAESQENTPILQTQATSPTNSPSGSEESVYGYQFEFKRTGSQTLADYEAESQENTPILQTQATSPTNSPSGSEERGNGYQFEFKRSGSQTQADYKAESPKTTTTVPKQQFNYDMGITRRPRICK